LKADNRQEKRIILNKLVESGINVTPSTLDFILKMDDPIKDLNSIIKETSFIPTFNGHLTQDILKKISDEKIQKILKRTIIEDNLFTLEQELNTKDISIDNKTTYDNKREVGEMQLHVSEVSENPIIPENVVKSKLQISQDIEHAIIPSNSDLKNNKKAKPIESAKTSFGFRPIAKEFSSNYKILKDPTGKLYTSGEYEDFYDLTLDKFNKLQNLMKKRSEVHSANNIKNITRLTNKSDISAIGMVKDIRTTKNGNYFLVLEDLTGTISVIIRKNLENQDNSKIIERIISDQLIYVEGAYNPGEKGNNGVVYANYVSKIDIPTDHQPNRSQEPLSIALISDVHIGSREFEESLWNKFIDFLNGKVGNKNLREIAGKIKYIIINGDLVDGIGVYPNQQDDLVISNIYNQFKKASELISKIPPYIKIFYSPGNHDPVRTAIPRPAVSKKYCEELLNIGVECIGNPSLIQTDGVNTLVFHGDSLFDMNMLIPELDNNKPVDTMKEMLICRHLAPIYGKKTQIAPTNKDWLVIDKIPDIFHTGHIHINGIGQYRNIFLVNSGCFQAQTDYMKSFGINPTPGIVPIVELDTFRCVELDLKKNN